MTPRGVEHVDWSWRTVADSVVVKPMTPRGVEHYRGVYHADEPIMW